MTQRRNLDNPHMRWPTADTEIRVIHVNTAILGLFAMRRGLLSDILGMYANLDNRVVTADRSRELLDSIADCERDLDSLNDRIVRAIATLLAA